MRYFCLRFAALALLALPAVRADNSLGAFSDQGDIGTASKPGLLVYDAAAKTYTIGSAGANMWFKEDDMHFVWKRTSGNLSIAADIAFPGASKQGHRKACLMLRQNLDPDSPYVDVARHGDGLTSLQFRQVVGGPTMEIQSNVASPTRVRLDKIGGVVYLSVAGPDGVLRPSGASIRLPFGDPFYVGLAVSAHDDTAFETAIFSRVVIGTASADAAKPQPQLHVITLPSGDRRVTDQP